MVTIWLLEPLWLKQIVFPFYKYQNVFIVHYTT